MNSHTPAAHAGQEQQGAVISTSELLSNLELEFNITGDEVEEPLNKLEAVIHLLSGCQDPKSDEFTVDEKQIAWALILAMGLTKEIQDRINDHRKHFDTRWKELERRLNACHILPRDLAKREPIKTGQEVRL